MQQESEEIRLLVGARLREERERLGFSQSAFGALAGVSLRTEQDWERGVSAAKSDFLSVVSQHGVDVLYVLTGQRSGGGLSLDPSRRSILENFERCSPEKQVEAIQYMALLAAGVAPVSPASGQPSGTQAKVSKSFMSVAIGNVGRSSRKK